MISLRFFAVILFLHLIGQSIGQSDAVDCTNSDNCKVDDSTSITHITCQENSPEGSPECTCTPEAACAALAADSMKYEDLDPTSCSEKCTKPTCTFWKFTKEGQAPAHKKHCYHMDENQCTERDDSVTCPDENHGTVTCESGTAEGVDCDGTEPPPPTPSPPTPYKDCPGPIVLGDDPTKYYQKWNCFEFLNGIPTPRDMYADESSMPVGGYCELLTDGDGSCKMDRFRWTCTGTDESNPNVWTNPNGNPTEDLKDDKLKEVGCKAEDYTIDPAQQEGRMISCAVEGSVDGTILAENGCIMLCDDLPAFSFYTDFADRGTRGWFYEIIGNPSSKAKLDPGMLDCWGKR